MIAPFPTSPEMESAIAAAEMQAAQTALALNGLADLVQSQIPECPIAPDRMAALLYCLADRLAPALDI